MLRASGMLVPGASIILACGRTSLTSSFEPVDIHHLYVSPTSRNAERTARRLYLRIHLLFLPRMATLSKDILQLDKPPVEGGQEPWKRSSPEQN